MFKRLLVPLDGTPNAAAALPLARTVARSTSAEIRLVLVVPDSAGNPSGQLRTEAESYLTKVAAEFSADGLVVNTVVRAGDVPAEIVREARASGSDLIVMATHGRGGVARAVLGSVAEHVLEQTSVPVLLLRPGGKRVTHLRTLLVPVDGTPGGALALGSAVALARAADARLVLLEVAVPIPLWMYAPDVGTYVDPLWDEDAQGSAQRYVDGLAARLRASGVTVEGRAVIGEVAKMVVHTADEVSADLIVMSTHALTGPARTLMGSVADDVVRTAHHPVLLVRRERGSGSGSEDEAL